MIAVKQVLKHNMEDESVYSVNFGRISCTVAVASPLS